MRRFGVIIGLAALLMAPLNAGQLLQYQTGPASLSGAGTSSVLLRAQSGNLLGNLSAAGATNLIHNKTDSPEAYRLGNLENANRGLLSFFPEESGLLSSLVQLSVEIDGVRHNLGEARKQAGRWEYTWSSRPLIPQASTVTFSARVSDGIAWSDWVPFQGKEIDNQVPSILALSSDASGATLNSQIGIVNSTWQGRDNSRALTYDVYGNFVSSLDKSVSELIYWLDAYDQVYLTQDSAGILSWNGKGLDPSRFLLGDPAHQPQLIPGPFPAVQLNHHDYLQGTVNGLVDQDFVIYAVYKVASDNQRHVLAELTGDTSLEIGADVATRYLSRVSGQTQAIVPVFGPQRLMQVIKYNASTRELSTYLNGVEVDTQRAVQLNLDGGVIIGNPPPTDTRFSGTINELIFQTNDATVSMDTIRYLATKWGFRHAEPAQFANLAAWITQSLPDAQGRTTWQDQGPWHYQVMALPAGVTTARSLLDYQPLGVASQNMQDLRLRHQVSILDAVVTGNLSASLLVDLSASQPAGAELMVFKGSRNDKLTLSLRTQGSTLLAGIQKQVGTQVTSLVEAPIQASPLTVITVVDDGQTLRLFQDYRQVLSTLSLDSASTLWDSLVFGKSVQGRFGEAAVFNGPLTAENRLALETQLMVKWGPIGPGNWTVLGRDLSTPSLQATESDNQFGLIKIVAKDRAGNQRSALSPVVYLPDRTAPELSRTDGGFSNILDIISGREDENIQFNLRPFQSDNVDAGDQLQWSVDLYVSDGDERNPLYDLPRASDQVLHRGLVRDGVLQLMVSPDANTDPPVQGNIFGKENAFIRLGLQDRFGNFAHQDVQVTLANVNDPPQLLQDILAGLFLRDAETNSIVYNMKIDEDSTGNLDIAPFIQDIDDDLSNLRFAITGDGLAQAGGFPHSSEYDLLFQSLYAQIGLKASGASETLTVVPTANWFGDLYSTIWITDETDTISTNFTVRVWPVNDGPFISSDTPAYLQLEEDLVATLNLHAYENDEIFEDRAPTFGNLLNWRVSTHNQQDIASITGELSILDRLLITPSSNFFGSTTMTVSLTDSDTVAALAFGANERYIPAPRTATLSLTIEWTPVNGTPNIAAIPEITTSEDVSVVTVNLSSFKSDDKDTAEQLSWTAQSSSPNLFSASVAGDVLTITPVANAWGQAEVALTLSDQDSIVSSKGYTPNPKTGTGSVMVSIDSVNDTPSLSGISLRGLRTASTTKVMQDDTLVATALGFQDVGYASGVTTTAIGNEYTQTNDIDRGFLRNSPQYHYDWTISNQGAVVQRLSSTGNASSTYSIDLSADYEGFTFEVAISPFDGVDSGTPITASIVVNTLPPAVSDLTAIPFGDFWTDTSNVTFNWTTVSDPDGDTVGYQVALWAVPSWDSPAPDVTAISPSLTFGFSATTLNGTLDATIPDGHYFWTLFSGNEIDPGIWDFRPSGWLHSLHVDTQPPQISTADAQAFTDLLSAQGSVELALNTRTIFGTKPDLANEGSLYEVVVNLRNEQDGAVVTTSSQLVPTTNNDAWSGLLNFPAGNSAYEIQFIDNVGNESTFITFNVIADTTPPPAPIISTGSGLSLVSGVYEGITSASVFAIDAQKEFQSAIFYRGLNVVNHTNTTNFILSVRPSIPSGAIVARDQSGNTSTSTNIDITFIIGEPELPTYNVSRSVINSPDNTAISGLSSDLIASITRTAISFTSTRDVSSYKLVDSSGITLASGSSVAAHFPVSIALLGNDENLSEGLNTLELQVFDLARNMATRNAQVTLKTTAPTTNLNIDGTIELVAGKWIVDINGDILSGLSHEILVGGVTQSIQTFANGTWRYFNNNANLETNDIVIRVTDEVFNVNTRVLWDSDDFDQNNDFITLSSLGGSSVLLPYDSLPVNIMSLRDLALTQENMGQLAGLSLASQEASLSRQSNRDDLFIHKGLEASMYQIYAKASNQDIIEDLDLSAHHIQVALPYGQAEKVSVSDILPVTFDEATRLWTEFMGVYEYDMENQAVIMTLDSTGKVALAELSSFSNSLSQMRVWPNPWVPEDDTDDNGTLETGITFDNLTQGARVRIYTLSGQLVADTVPGAPTWVWYGQNRNGRDVASGVYLYVVTNDNETKRGKLTVIR